MEEKHQVAEEKWRWVEEEHRWRRGRGGGGEAEEVEERWRRWRRGRGGGGSDESRAGAAVSGNVKESVCNGEQNLILPNTQSINRM